MMHLPYLGHLVFNTHSREIKQVLQAVGLCSKFGIAFNTKNTANRTLAFVVCFFFFLVILAEKSHLIAQTAATSILR